MDPIRRALRGTVGCRVEIRSPDSEEARASAQRLAQIFKSSGYLAEVVIVTESAREGIFIETSPESAGCALTIQSAFHAANLETTVAVHELHPRDRVLLSIGPNGIG